MRREDAYGGFQFFSLPAELSSSGVEVQPGKLTKVFVPSFQLQLHFI